VIGSGPGLERQLTRLRALVQRFLGHWGRSILLSLAVGVLSGLAAVALKAGLSLGHELLIGRIAAPGSAEVLPLRWELLLLPALGGLFSGLVVQRLAGLPPAHGTDQFVAAFHRRDGAMPLPPAGLRAIAAIGVISAGGSAGPEGPIAGLGAAIGSSVGRWFGLTPRDRRVLLVSGCAAAVGALFGCPLGGALFASSVLYKEPGFEGSALVSAFIASAIGFTTSVFLAGHASLVLYAGAGLAFRSPTELPVYVLLGLVCGVTALFFAAVLRRVEGLFGAMQRAPMWLRPALGGIVAGAIACALPQVMDSQYRLVQNAFSGSLYSEPGPLPGWLGWGVLLALVVVAKCVATAFSVGSGAAGGVLGPSVFIGGCVGASLAALSEGLAPGLLSREVQMAMVPVGMAGVLSGAMRTPIAAMVMVMEMTGSFGLIVPLMLVTMTAYVVGRGGGLVAGQIRSAAESPAHAGDALVSLLERYRVAQALARADFTQVDLAASLDDLLRALRPGDCATVPVLEGRRLVGVIDLAELRNHLGQDELPSAVIAADLMRARPARLEPGDTLYEGLSALQEQGLDALPVVAGGGDDTLIGMLRRSDVYSIVQRHVAEMRASLLREHVGLAAIESESQLAHLLSVMPVPESGRLERIPVDATLAGHSLADLDFRNSRGAEVIAVQTRAHDFQCPPDARRPLEAGDALLVMRSEGSPTAGGGERA
jgi:chloride channel protein, CIC family